MMENRSFDHYWARLQAPTAGRPGCGSPDRHGRKFSTHRLVNSFQGCGFLDPDHSWDGGRTESRCRPPYPSAPKPHDLATLATSGYLERLGFRYRPATPATLYRPLQAGAARMGLGRRPLVAAALLALTIALTGGALAGRRQLHARTAGGHGRVQSQAP